MSKSSAIIITIAAFVALPVLLPVPLSAQRLGVEESGSRQMSLREALSEAMTNHPSLQYSAGSVEAERGRKLQAVSPPQPELTFHEEEIRAGTALGQGEQKIFMISQGFDLPLFLGSRGTLHSHLQQSALHRLDFTRSSVRSDVLTAYSLLFARMQQLRILEINHDLYIDFAKRASSRAEVGEGTTLEAARARSELANASIAVTKGKRDRMEAISQFSEALGRPLDGNIVLTDSLQPGTPVSREPKSDIPSLDNHPLLLAARQQRAGYDADASWRWMQYLPSFKASWFRQEFATFGSFWGAELTAEVPLWFMFDTRGQNKEAYALARQAEAELTLTETVLRGRTLSAATALDAATQALSLYTSQLLDDAGIILRNARTSYDEGEIGYIEYIDAQRSANTTWLGYFDSLADWYRAVAEYELATGTIILE